MTVQRVHYTKKSKETKLGFFANAYGRNADCLNPSVSMSAQTGGILSKKRSTCITTGVALHVGTAVLDVYRTDPTSDVEDANRSCSCHLLRFREVVFRLMRSPALPAGVLAYTISFA